MDLRQQRQGIYAMLLMGMGLLWGATEVCRACVVPLSLIWAIEAEMVRFPPEGPACHDALIDYFQNANEGLWHHLEGINRSVHLDDKQKSLTTITAVAGLGKSFVVYKMPIDSDVTVATIKLGKVLAKLAEEGKIDLVTRPDLQSLDGEVVLNQLPALVDPNALQVEDLLRMAQDNSQAAAQVVVVDDLDEVDAQTALVVMQKLKQYVNQMEATLHVIMFGRAEGFWEDNQPAEQPSFVLHGPQHLTTGDLRFRCEDYGQFKYKRALPATEVEAFMAMLAGNPYLIYTLEPLAAGGAVIDLALSHEGQAKPEVLRSTLFGQFLARNQDSHGRPPADNDLYVQILEQAAIFPVLQQRFEKDTGYFEVTADDEIRVKDAAGQPREFSLRTVLNRSGLVELDITRFPQTFYRFTPLWVQTHLIEKYNLGCQTRAVRDAGSNPDGVVMYANR